MPRRRRGGGGGGFTLTELLIVISLIVLVMALAVPAFNLISGTRSIDAAQNQIAAYLNTAKQTAIARQNNVGVLFYVDPLTSRTAMRLVERVRPQPWIHEAPDPADNAAPFTMIPKTYKVGDYVSAIRNLTSAPTDFPGIETGQPRPRTYICTQEHTATQSNGPPNGTANNAQWTLVNDFDLELVPDREPQLLPQGIGTQFAFQPLTWGQGQKYYFRQRVTIEQTGTTGGPRQYEATAEHVSTINNTDITGDSKADGPPPSGGNWQLRTGEGWLRIGLILFDGSGQPVYDNRSGYSINERSRLYNALDPAGGGFVFPYLYARSEILVYDDTVFKGQRATNGGGQFNDADLMTVGPRDVSPGQGGKGFTTNVIEQAEDAWLNQNGTYLAVSKSRGTLVRAE